MTVTRALIDYPRYRRVHAALHRCWSQREYRKKDWMELEDAIVELAREGIGEPDAQEPPP